MIEKIFKLQSYLSNTSFQDISFEELEKMTGAIIADDTYESLPDTLQDSIELLDMYELNNLNKVDVDNCLHGIAIYLQTREAGANDG